MIFDMFPYTNFHELNLDWILHELRKMSNKLDQYVVNNQITFADPIAWTITNQYPAHVIVKNAGTDTWYISRKPVPAGISLNNTEYWEELGAFTPAGDCEIKNVQDYGALGVQGVDYTAQIQAAIDDGNIIFFPAGFYSFGTINLHKQVYIFGDGDSTVFIPLHRYQENNAYKPMLALYDDAIFENINFTGNNYVVVETGPQEVTQAVIRAYNSNIEFRKCSINDMINTYRLSVSSVPFHEREGIFLFSSECDTTFDCCKFGNYYGNELVWASRSRVNFGKGHTVIKNCIFDNRTGSSDPNVTDGSCFDVLGGVVECYNNSGRNTYSRGSFFNLFGDVVIFANNNFIEFYGPGGLLDTCEGYYIKNTTVVVDNNYIDFKSSDTSLKIFSKNVKISGNYLTGACPIKITQTNDYTISDTYHNSSNAETDLDTIIIENNNIETSLNGANYFGTGVVIGQSQQSAGARSKYKYYNIHGNNFRNNAAVTSPRQQLEMMTHADIAMIQNNVFNEAGTAQSGARLAFIGVADTSAMKIVLNGNYFAPAASEANVIFGGSTVVSNLNTIFAANSTEDTTNIHVGPSTMPVDILANNVNMLA